MYTTQTGRQTDRQTDRHCWVSKANWRFISWPTEAPWIDCPADTMCASPSFLQNILRQFKKFGRVNKYMKLEKRKRFFCWIQMTAAYESCMESTARYTSTYELCSCWYEPVCCRSIDPIFFLYSFENPKNLISNLCFGLTGFCHMYKLGIFLYNTETWLSCLVVK